MIRFILLQNRQGKTRLAKYYIPLEDSEKHKVEFEVHRLVVSRDPKFTNFVEDLGSIVEREEFAEDFDKQLRTELKWSRLEDTIVKTHVAGWGFWCRQDNRPPHAPPVSDCGLISIVQYLCTRSSLELYLRIPPVERAYDE
ncbi:uncharacterized protein LOC131333033 isoform X2 [Rhododendron vialii]|uniref:uncharacterized protein LOC131333033 isoform X2 n=1 Tax=Rhododendron vialii TaxID=182163 RepID=UPI00265F304B|nr:uncharacterized protein LOC131333033 isoform X2 [Rhododendron vialii]XP_058223338.1 uncharacterized protein LOC131333033 isoform X2 [Rhododendron vialii]XP_058223346.1 uncharacterized protein LOC131333033 isoform X2 [Rhododendron vialii]